jgi:hypothetical protein
MRMCVVPPSPCPSAPLSPAGARPDDVTRLVDLYPGTSVTAFWEAVDPSSTAALATPLEVRGQPRPA